MQECICVSCKNLKSVMDVTEVDENGVAEEYECEFGFPGEACLECEVDECELTCEHYVSDQVEENFVIAKCVACGKELKLSSNNDDGSDVYCVTCYLNK